MKDCLLLSKWQIVADTIQYHFTSESVRMERDILRIFFWAMPASALQYSTTELYASLRWVRPSRASYLTRVLHTSRINNFESVMWVKKNWTGENVWAGKWHKGADSSQSCSIDRKFDLLVNYTQFPASVTSELNYIITFYDIIITSRFVFSKEADLFKDLSLYV